MLSNSLFGYSFWTHSSIHEKIRHVMSRFVFITFYSNSSVLSPSSVMCFSFEIRIKNGKTISFLCSLCGVCMCTDDKRNPPNSFLSIYFSIKKSQKNMLRRLLVSAVPCKFYAKQCCVCEYARYINVFVVFVSFHFVSSCVVAFNDVDFGQRTTHT